MSTTHDRKQFSKSLSQISSFRADPPSGTIFENLLHYCYMNWTRGPKGHISCTWVQCATFVDGSARVAIFVFQSAQKHKIVRRHWVLASCKLSFNSVQRFQRSRKCFSQSKAMAAILISDKSWRECKNLNRSLATVNVAQLSKVPAWKARIGGSTSVFILKITCFPFLAARWSPHK